MDDETSPPAGDFHALVDPGAALAPQTPLAHLAHMLALSDDAILGTDPQLRLTVFNRAAAQLFGYAASEVLGQPLSLLLPALATLDPAGATPGVAEQAIMAMRKDGTSLEVSARIGWHADADGPRLSVVVPASAPSLQAAQPLDETSLLQHVQDAVITSDPGFRITGWNRAAEALYGWRADEALGQITQTVLQTEYPDGDRAQVLEAFRAHGAWKGEVIQHHRDGHPLVIMAATALIRAPTGEPIGVVSVNRDISERKAAEAQLRAYAARLEVITEASRAFVEAGAEYQALIEQIARISADRLHAACSIRLLSDDGQWLDVAAVGHYGPAAQQDMQASLAPWRIHLDDRAPAAVAARTGEAQFVPVIDPEALAATVPPERRALLQRFFPHSLMVLPLRLHGRSIGSLMLARDARETPAFTADDLSLAQDLTDRAAQVIGNAQLLVRVQAELAERQRAEQALEAERTLLARRVAERTADLSLANAELARALRLKDEFLATMSHELRTPLNGILGRSEALQEAIYGPVTAEQVTALHSIIESGQHLLTLINDILDLSKIEAGRLTLERATLDVDLLGTMSLRMVAQSALVKHITLSSRFDGQVQYLLADERRLKQILVNLLSNAVKFTPEGGQVGLEVQGNPAQETVTFTVWDTGIGIAAEDLPKLFQPFVQIDSSLSRQYTGTGLGLSLVARFAQAHGGSVAVESTPGQGSRFSVTLPWTPTDLAARPVPATAAVDTARPAVRQALVVEDSPTAAAQITRYLRELGARVAVHPHGTGTVERAVELQPDLIILDLLLPDDDGWAVLRQLKAEPRTRDIPVLVITVVDEPEQARQLGAAALLVKPIDRPMLEQALRQILAHPEPPPEPIALVMAPYLGRPRVLLADDNEETLETLADYLRAKGYVVLLARNGREAIVQAQEERPDVILMDIQMPGMDGLEAIRRLRAEAALAQVPIIAVTALAMPGDRERCLEAGADAYLAKPIHLRTLMATMEAQRQQRVGADPDPERPSEASDQP
ncbi:MAG: response regulator [Chloroflexales bacterium]|nr:response regulator [Chloroflexales bacterium]